MGSRFRGIRSRQVRERYRTLRVEGVHEGGEADSAESRDPHVQFQNEAVQLGTDVKPNN